MTQSHLGKLFGAFGFILLVITVNTWLASQGAKAILKIPLLHEERPSMAFLALILGSVMLTVTSTIGFLHAKRHGTSWHDRIPAVWLENLNTSMIEARWYQAVVLLLLVGVPVASGFHFIGIVADAKLCESGSKVLTPVLDAWLSGIPKATDQIRLVDGLTVVEQANGVMEWKCVGGIQVFPGWEFLIVGAALAVSIAMTVAFLTAIFRAQSPPSAEPGAGLP